MVSAELIKETFLIRNPEVVRKLSEVTRIRRCEKGEIIYAIGDMQTNIYILLNGIVYCYFIDEMQSIITDCFVVERGYPVNTENLKLPSMFTAQALVRTELLEIPADIAFDLMKEYPELLWEYIRFMQMALAYHWYISNKRIHYPAKKRYEWLRKTWPEVEQVASNQQIASFLGIRSQSLSRLRYLSRKTAKEDTDQNDRKGAKEDGDDLEDVDILVTRDLRWNYARLSKALKEGQYYNADGFLKHPHDKLTVKFR